MMGDHVVQLARDAGVLSYQGHRVLACCSRASASARWCDASARPRIPLGWGVHRWIVPIMFDAAGFGYPPQFVAVYQPWQLLALGATGMLLAVLGALIPAGWAAHTRAATALRAE